jgi:hypothetical protein
LENRTIVGAAYGTVGAAGGWIMGGGHGALSSRHGLGTVRYLILVYYPLTLIIGVDNVIQFMAVTANGDILTVNSYQNTDLFWALRGGGGGTYAVVTSATYLTHDPVPMTLMSFSRQTSLHQSLPSVCSPNISNFIQVFLMLGGVDMPPYQCQIYPSIIGAWHNEIGDACQSLTRFRLKLAAGLL